MSEFFWFLVGAMFAIILDKYKEWYRYRENLKRINLEIQKITNSLEARLHELPKELRSKIKVAQEGGISKLGEVDLRGLPLIEITQPHDTAAWQTFISNGFTNNLNENDYKVLSDSYNILEGTNFVKGLTPSLLSACASDIIDLDTKQYLKQAIKTNPLQPIIFALPKMKAANKLVESLNKTNCIKSFLTFVF